MKLLGIAKGLLGQLLEFKMKLINMVMYFSFSYIHLLGCRYRIGRLEFLQGGILEGEKEKGHTVYMKDGVNV